jgi:hypothetical protein
VLEKAATDAMAVWIPEACCRQPNDDATAVGVQQPACWRCCERVRKIKDLLAIYRINAFYNGGSIFSLAQFTWLEVALQLVAHPWHDSFCSSCSDIWSSVVSSCTIGFCASVDWWENFVVVFFLGKYRKGVCRKDTDVASLCAHWFPSSHVVSVLDWSSFKIKFIQK